MTMSAAEGRSDEVLRFEGVERVYPGPPQVHALRPFDLTVHAGEFVSIVGPSGSGKSTFLHLAGLLDRPTNGRVFIEGRDTTDLGDAERTALRGRHVGFVFQHFHLMSRRTVLDNLLTRCIYLGIPRKDRESLCLEALTRVNLQHRAQALCGELSGGEMQRVAIARALTGSPRLVLCDEPTGNLDSVNSGRTLELLDELHADGVTVVLITHDPAVAAHAQRCVTIRDGQVGYDAA